jgi:TRAP-type uncharacterized transport system fused permease subunit
MGIDPMAAHMIILYYGCLSLISPPVAVAAFVAANLANADPNRTGWTAMAFGWTIFVIPFIFVYSGTLLLKGDPLSIAIDTVTAVVGVWLISAAVMAYSVRDLGIVDRLGYGLAGFLLLLPVGAFPQARWCNVAGGALALVLLLRERFARPQGVAPATASSRTADAGAAGQVPAKPSTAEQAALRDRLGVRGSGDAE